MTLKKSFILIVFLSFLFSGCASFSGQAENLRSSVKESLSFYKNMSSDSASPFLDELFSLYFQDFDFSIKRINLSGETASVLLTLTTLDGNAVAKDYQRAKIIQEITNTPSLTNSNPDKPKENLQIIYELLSAKNYPVIKTDCTLIMEKSSQNDWIPCIDAPFLNAFSGGLLGSICDSQLITPGEAVSIFFDAFLSMTAEQKLNYLGIGKWKTQNPSYYEIASAIAEQLPAVFSCKVEKETVFGCHASVTIHCSSIDLSAVKKDFSAAIEPYLSSAEAVIDGITLRQKKSHQLLTELLLHNQHTRSVDLDIFLINDGTAWKLENSNSLLSAVFFGAFDSSLKESTLHSYTA